MNEPTPHVLDLLTDYLAGESTPDARAELESWMAQHPERRQVVENFRSVWAQVRDRARPDLDIDSAVQTIEAYAATHPFPEVTPTTKGRPWNWRGTVGLISLASAAVLMLVSVMRITEESGISPAQQGQAVYTTRAGQQAVVELEGDRVILNVASTLIVPADYGKRTRSLELDGQGAFQITPHDDVPLTVNAWGVMTRVLGTEFGIRAYDIQHVRVSVRSGKVAVTSNDAQLVLGARDMVSVSPSQNVLTHNAEVSTDFGFTSGVLSLHGQPLSEVLDDLERWFDTDIQLHDASLAHRGLTGTVPLGTPADLAQFLEVVLNVRVEQHGRVITVFSPSSPH